MRENTAYVQYSGHKKGTRSNAGGGTFFSGGCWVKMPQPPHPQQRPGMMMACLGGGGGDVRERRDDDDVLLFQILDEIRTIKQDIIDLKTTMMALVDATRQEGTTDRGRPRSSLSISGLLTERSLSQEHRNSSQSSGNLGRRTLVGPKLAKSRAYILLGEDSHRTGPMV